MIAYIRAVLLKYNHNCNIYLLADTDTRSSSSIENCKMNTIKNVIYLMCIFLFLVVHCNAFIGRKANQSMNKTGCVPLGERCNTFSDCCGHDDPESGHCVVCYSFIAGLTGRGHDKCRCTYGSVTVDPDTHRVTSNVCNDPD